MKNLQNIEVSIYNKQNELVKKFSMRKGGNLWVSLRKNGIPIGSACSGVGVCGACNVSLGRISKEKFILSSTQAMSNDAADLFPMGIEVVSPQSEFETTTLLRNGKNPADRLACLIRVYCDISIRAEYW